MANYVLVPYFLLEAPIPFYNFKFEVLLIFSVFAFYYEKGPYSSALKLKPSFFIKAWYMRMLIPTFVTEVLHFVLQYNF